MRYQHLTQAELKELLDYDPETGVFTWRKRLSQRARAGMQAGCLRKEDGYRLIGINRKTLCAHRLAWLYVHGSWPQHDIDHINGNRDDNRIANLRDVPNQINCENRRTGRRGGKLGTYFHKPSGLWFAAICVDGKKISLGCHKTEEEAHATYVSAKRILHDGCTI